ncbi:uncharacterized protein LOC134739685 [Pongo pygmaeus]|uniref:uncharacterized protein LOC134739685 n=1 Tax=Pongo pygmaeus TaxID=9600 RepID=UPI00300C1FE4
MSGEVTYCKEPLFPTRLREDLLSRTELCPPKIQMLESKPPVTHSVNVYEEVFKEVMKGERPLELIKLLLRLIRDPIVSPAPGPVLRISVPGSVQSLFHQ